MTICLVEMRAARGRRDHLLAMCRDWMPGALAAGCRNVEILLDATDPDRISLLERWPSDDVFEAFAASEWTNAMQLARYAELAVGMPILRKYRTLT